MTVVLMMQAAYAGLQSHTDVIATLAASVALVDGIIEIGKSIIQVFGLLPLWRRRPLKIT